MPVPVTVPRLGLEGANALVAEWYQPDGATVRKGDPVFRLETDFITVDVEAEDDGVLRHQHPAGATWPDGEVIALILAPGECLPGDRETQVGRRASPGPARRRRRQAAHAHPPADVGLAAQEREVAPMSGLPDGHRPWEALVSEAPGGEDVEAPEPMLLFPRIVSALKEEAELLEAPAEEEAHDDATVDPGPETKGVPRSAPAWDLVPGEMDFNPDWLLERAPDAPEAPEPPRAKDRFQASNIRSLALGKRSAGQPPPSAAPIAGEVSSSEEQPVTHLEAPLESLVTAVRQMPTVGSVADRRGEAAPGTPLHIRTTVDVGEAMKMRDQLTREWMGSNVRPTNEDIVLRAIARALHESAAFRRRTDVVGLRPLSGISRTVHLLGDAATRPFRDAVASLAALRETPGADIACVCTLTSFAELDLDEAVPALPGGQPLAFAMGSVRDLPRYRGADLQRACMIILTLSYDSEAMPDGAAARLIARVRELVEAPYALLAD